jgi:hypothetical protein
MGATLTSDDKRQIAGRGMILSDVERQLQVFREGFPSIQLVAAATGRHGIHQLNPKRIDELVAIFENFSSDHRIVKFVPASGAASRMFKHLYEFRSSYRGTLDDQLELLKDRGPDSVLYFFEHIEEFSFFPMLEEAFYNRGLDFKTVMQESRYEKILNTLLTDKGLNFGNLPKALIPFHVYANGYRTAFAEHLAEGAFYAISGARDCYIHFTSLPQHVSLMEEHFNEIKKQCEDTYGVAYHISYSIQDPSTDTIAAGENNEPFRDEHGNLTFRPGGHGALLQNLNNIEADIIIIKNIDNICHDRFKTDTYT